ncbi:MAG: hypothetical protein VKL59_04375 [Nostocaceae cyanobacterium]|nr:hypothetical protein [Nostocaceae cyanobacterium]
MHTPENLEAGDRVVILSPAYLAGKQGVICTRELLSDGQPSQRWLIEVVGEDMVVSLNPDEFELLH